MSFSTDGRKLYLDYTRAPDGYTVIVEYELGDRATIDDDTRRELLVVEQPFANHNGGQLAIGPDGFLYIGLGDGGDGGDPFGHGQDTATLLGSILRIDPEAGTEEGPAYGIPTGNPFADGDGGQPEIWLYGVRNPWRFTFDSATGDLWVADVGQDEYEEVNRLPAASGFDAGQGDNLGWAEMEGTHSYEGGENPDGGVLPDPRVRPRPRGARSSAATCTAGTRSPASRASTSSATPVPPASGACSWTATPWSTPAPGTSRSAICTRSARTTTASCTC